MDVIVKCGNGGDWEWANDQHYWKLWITQNMPGIAFKTGCSEECKADDLCVTFEKPADATFFSLKRPIYIRYEDIR
jgi:hypothetical protein